MKIAFVVRSFPVISQSFIDKQIVGLLKLGHDVQIFAGSNPNQSEVQSDVQEYNLLDRTHYPSTLSNIKTIRRLKLFCSAFQSFLKRPVLTGRLLRHLLGMEGGFSYKHFYFVLPFIYGDFDIIHAHFGPLGLQSLILKDIGLPGRLVTTLYGYDIATYTKENGKEVYRDLFTRGDMFLFISETGRARILELGCDPERLVKIPMGIDLEKIEFKERSLGSGQSVNILSVGRLVEMKGREFAIRAVARIAEKYPNLKYDIVGDGELRDSLELLIDELGVADVIRIHGWIDSEKLSQFYRNAHIFLHPSVEARNGNVEGQGVVLGEAQASGIPVITTDHGAFPENVIDGKTGFLVPERDVDAIAEKIGYLIENHEKWAEMGKCGRAFVESRLDIDKLNELLEQTYKSILA